MNLSYTEPEIAEGKKLLKQVISKFPENPRPTGHNNISTNSSWGKDAFKFALSAESSLDTYLRLTVVGTALYLYITQQEVDPDTHPFSEAGAAMARLISSAGLWALEAADPDNTRDWPEWVDMADGMI